MKKVILLLWILPFPALCQVAENFETGIITHWIQSSPNRWNADNISAISGSFSLHHVFDNSEEGNDRIGIRLENLRPDLGTTNWSFRIRHGYEPSSSNNWAVFLMADNGTEDMRPGGNLNGYAVGVNLSGYDDTLRLWKVKKGVPAAVVTTPVNWQNNVGISSAAKVDAERSAAGFWKITISSQTGQVLGTASGSDPELFGTGWLGIYYKYSSARDRLLWLDDIFADGVFIADTVPPGVIKITQAGRNAVDITLDEEPSDDFQDLSNFRLNNVQEASAIIKKSQNIFRVSFPGQFLNKVTNIVSISNICDIRTNCRKNTTVSFIPVWAEAGDIVISEIMADPLPPVGLPPAEYLELKNRSEFPVGLEEWKLVTEGQTTIFPPVEINAGGNLIVCHISDTALFSKFGKKTGLKSFPLLADDGKLIILTDSSGNMIHGVEYSKDWYRDILKSEGGWSLEMVDISYPFTSGSNWKASSSRSGGTPGKDNSVNAANPDRTFHGISNIFPTGETSVLLTFTEPVLNLPYESNRITIGGKPIHRMHSADLLNRKFVVEPGHPLVARKIYTLSLPSMLTDYSGNSIEDLTARFGLPEEASKGDIVFNELLFNPQPGMPDFIEFTNNSDKIIDASMLMMVSVDDESGDTSSVVVVSQEPRCILPGALYAVTTDSEALKTRYFSSADTNIFEVSQLPSMPDDDGHLILYNRQLNILDEVRYSDDMHYPLLSGSEGISLEKLRPGSSSALSGSWHSASEASGWATPGAQNSIFTDSPSDSDKMEFSSGRISPDNDGFEDLLVIDFNLTGYDNVLSVSIFDEGGNLIRKLAENLLAGSHASVTWDGTADGGSLTGRGIYIVFASVFDTGGKTRKWKRVCTVLR